MTKRLLLGRPVDALDSAVRVQADDVGISSISHGSIKVVVEVQS